MNWCSVVCYDPESPTGLRWIVDTQNKKSGDIAGSRHPDGYSRVQFEGTREACHVVVWLLHGKTRPEGDEVDHKDGRRSNNVFENLRLASTSLNARNRKKACDNTSGITGVSLGGGKWPAWIASWNPIGKRQTARSFSINKYGYERACQLACEHRAAMIQEMNLQGAGYTERHGT